MTRAEVDAFVQQVELTSLVGEDETSRIIERNLLSRLDHAAYLGRELARAERSLETGELYVQDRASGEVCEECKSTPGCGCP